MKCVAKSIPPYISIRALLNSFLFKAAPGDGATNLINTTFSVILVISGELASLKAILFEKTFSFSEPHYSTIALDTGKAKTTDILVKFTKYIFQ